MSENLKQLKITPYDDTCFLPDRAHSDDAGLDLYARRGLVIGPHSAEICPCGFYMALPGGYTGLVCTRSSSPLKRAYKVANSPGVIDSGFRGEVAAILHNFTDDTIKISPFEKVAQLLIVPIELPELTVVPSLDETERGDKGYGSTGGFAPSFGNSGEHE